MITTKEIISKLSEIGVFVFGLPVYESTGEVILSNVTTPVLKNNFGQDVIELVDASNPAIKLQVRLGRGVPSNKASYDVIKFAAKRAASGTVKSTGKAWNIAAGKTTAFAV